MYLIDTYSEFPLAEAAECCDSLEREEWQSVIVNI